MALPPTATACDGWSISTPSKIASIRSRILRISAAEGGSEEISSSASVPEPICQAALLLLGEDLHRDPRRPADRRGDRVGVARLANRGGGNCADRFGAELTSETNLGGDDLGNLGDLLRDDCAVPVDRLVDAGVGALFHHLLELAVDRLGDEHARRI